MSAQVQANPSDPYWGQVGLVLQQFRGLVAGHTEHCDNALALDDLLLLNAAGDVETLATLFKAQGVLVDARAALSRRPASREYPVPQALLETDCSALVRVLPDFSNLFATQATWRGYFAMLRSYKFYLYGVDPQAWLAARGRVSPSDAKYSVSFSSQPAFLSSKDDFYITSHGACPCARAHAVRSPRAVVSAGLVTMETTNDVFNQSLYVYVVPSTVPCWVRSIVANRVGVDGDTWTSTFARYNSGTYNNQWMVVDYNRFVPGAKDASSALLDGALWLAEQIPGYVERYAPPPPPLARHRHHPSLPVPCLARACLTSRPAAPT
jgi:hypothetical protein